MAGRSWFWGVATTGVLLACAGSESEPAGETPAVSPSGTNDATSSSPPAGSPNGAGPMTSTAGPDAAGGSTNSVMNGGSGSLAPTPATPSSNATATASGGVPNDGVGGSGGSGNGGNGTAMGGATATGGASNGGAIGPTGGTTGVAGSVSVGGTSNQGGTGASGTADPNARRFILRDEGLSRLTHVDLAAASDSWSVVVPTGRDLQLIGDNRVLIGTDNGFEERSLMDGSKVFELTSFPGTIAAQRSSDGNTVLVGLDWQNQSGITLAVVDDGGNVSDTINYPGYTYVRLVRPTPAGTYLVTANTQVFEGDSDGNIVWQVTVTSDVEPHAWTGLRLADGNTLVSTGYGASLQVFSPDEQLVDTLTGPGDVTPYFFSGLQVLGNGNYLVANWQGHGEDFGQSGHQLLEYDPQGDLVWSWQQDPNLVSSLQAVILLDGLDTSLLHVTGANGAWVPAP